MSQALQGQPVENFTEPTDNGKIGGPDGTWGTGGGSSTRKRYTSNQWYRSTNSQDTTTETPNTTENTQPTNPTLTPNTTTENGQGGNGDNDAGTDGGGGTDGSEVPQ